MKRINLLKANLLKMKPKQLAVFLEGIVARQNNCNRCLYCRGGECTVEGDLKKTCTGGIAKWLKQPVKMGK